MNHRARLTAAVHRFMAASPWLLVDDTYLFGLDDRNGGRWGCACVMGAAGTEFGLTVHFGAVGFSLLEKLSKGELDNSTLVAKSDGVTFILDDFTLTSRKSKGMERYVVEKKKVRSGSARGYPLAWRLKPGMNPQMIDPEEALFLTRCLEAVAQLAESKTLGKVPLNEDGRTLFYNMTDEGASVALEKNYRQIEAADVTPGKVVLTPELLASLRSRPRHEGRYFLSIFSPVASIKGRIFWATILLDEGTGEVIGTTAEDNFETAALVVLRNHLRRVPREIWTDSLQVFDALVDPLAEIDVECVQTSNLPELAHARESLNAAMQRGSR